MTEHPACFVLGMVLVCRCPYESANSGDFPFAEGLLFCPMYAYTGVFGTEKGAALCSR